MNSTEKRDLVPGEEEMYRISPPSPDVKERVLNAGRAAWVAATPEPTDILWVLPVLRLAACLAIAAGFVHIGNATSKRSAARWAAFEPALRTQSELTRLPSEGTVSPLAAVAVALPPENAPHDLLTRQRRIQNMLRAAANRNG